MLNVTSITNEECEDRASRTVRYSILCASNPAGQGICNVSFSVQLNLILKKKKQSELIFLLFSPSYTLWWRQGDSGGALINSKNELVGVVNWSKPFVFFAQNSPKFDFHLFQFRVNNLSVF